MNKHKLRPRAYNDFHRDPQFHESKGVKFHMQSKIGKIVPSSSDTSKAEAVVVTHPSGEEVTLEADAVIMGVGVAPATEFLKKSPGFEQFVDKTGAVTVDEFLKVKGLDGSVYAIGEFRVRIVWAVGLPMNRRYCVVPSTRNWRAEAYRALERTCTIRTLFLARVESECVLFRLPETTGVPLERLSQRARANRSSRFPSSGVLVRVSSILIFAEH